MGDSTRLPGEDNEMTTESLARDLVDLLAFLEWKELAICGFSMGGESNIFVLLQNRF